MLPACTHLAAWPHTDGCTSSVQGCRAEEDTSADEETVSDDSQTESDDESQVISSMAARQGQGRSIGSLDWAAPVSKHSSRTPYMDTRLPAPTQRAVAQRRQQQQQQELAAPADLVCHHIGDQASSGTAYHACAGL